MTHVDVESMREELEHYRSERDKIRSVIGQIGGAGGGQKERVLNIGFIVVVVALFIFDLLQYTGAIPHLWPHTIAMEVAVLLVSLKIIWMIHQQRRVEHFQFWILNSIEFRLNDLGRRFKKMEQELSRPSS